jgi:acetyl esterase/lipase
LLSQLIRFAAIIAGMKQLIFWGLATALLAAQPAVAQTKAAKKAPRKPRVDKYDPAVPKPTLSAVRYGKHSRHILDFWKAKSDQPTPVAFVIHGGGWQGGSKERLQRFADAQALLDAGISVVAPNYRYVKQAVELGVQPPVKAPLHDAARALQFVRSKAKEWNIDKERIGAAGGSAGACSSLWLAFHDDLADPKSADPVARESSRLWCAAVTGAQTSLDPKQMKEWTPNSKYGGHAFGFGNFAKFLEGREKVMPWIDEYSPYHNVTTDDPPIYLIYSRPPNLGKAEKDPTHTANFGVQLQEHCQETGVRCELVYPGAKKVKFKTPTDFLIATLKSKPSKTAKNTGLKSLLNGKDLSGWDGDPKLWKVENGIVVGTCAGPAAMKKNSFLIWRGGEVKDFELRATIRVIGDNNSGIQYRSRERPDIGKWVISGYQNDVHPAIEHTGMTYEEKGRGLFGLNGKNVLLDPDGQRWLLSEHEPVKVDLSKWNEFTVIARGNHLIHKVNGKVTSELTDHHHGRALEGLVAIQLHRGNANRVELRDVRLKTLRNAKLTPLKIPTGATTIERPKTSRPQGIGPAIKPKKR